MASHTNRRAGDAVRQFFGKDQQLATNSHTSTNAQAFEYIARGAQVYETQTYHPTGREPYVRPDGSQSKLIVWRSHCAECNAPFKFRTRSESRRPFTPSRRCPARKRPGARVRKKVQR